MSVWQLTCVNEQERRIGTSWQYSVNWRWTWQLAVSFHLCCRLSCQPPSSPPEKRKKTLLAQPNLERFFETLSALHAPLVTAWHSGGKKAIREHWFEGKGWRLGKEENQWMLRRWGAGTQVCYSSSTTKGQCRKRELGDSQSAENHTLQAASAAPAESKLSVYCG